MTGSWRWLFYILIVKTERRRRGLGSEAWDRSVEEVLKRGGTGLAFQGVLTEAEGEELSGFLEKRCKAPLIRRMSAIFRLDPAKELLRKGEEQWYPKALSPFIMEQAERTTLPQAGL